MSNEQALRQFESARDIRETRHERAVQEAIAEFKHQCRNDKTFFLEQFSHSLEHRPPIDDALVHLLYELCTNRVPGNTQRLVNELQEQFKTHLHEMAYDYVEDYPPED